MADTRPALSFEYFPPQTEAGMDRLDATHRRLSALEPPDVRKVMRDNAASLVGITP